MEQLIFRDEYFKKINKHLFSCILSFSECLDLTTYSPVSRSFFENIKFYLKIFINKDKNIENFYKGNIFIFNSDCNVLFRTNIFPYIKTPEMIKILFENESLMIKRFIYNFEGVIQRDDLFIKKKDNKFYLNLRKQIIGFISRLVKFYFDKLKIKELYFTKSKLGKEACLILSYLIKNSKFLEFIDLKLSKLESEDVLVLLNGMEKNHSYFTLDLTGVKLDLKVIKSIKGYEKTDLKKNIIIDKTELNSLSKITNENVSKKKYRDKNNYNI